MWSPIPQRTYTIHKSCSYMFLVTLLWRKKSGLVDKLVYNICAKNAFDWEHYNRCAYVYTCGARQILSNNKTTPNVHIMHLKRSIKTRRPSSTHRPLCQPQFTEIRPTRIPRQCAITQPAIRRGRQHSTIICRSAPTWTYARTGGT